MYVSSKPLPEFELSSSSRHMRRALKEPVSSREQPEGHAACTGRASAAGACHEPGRACARNDCARDVACDVSSIGGQQRTRKCMPSFWSQACLQRTHPAKRSRQEHGSCLARRHFETGVQSPLQRRARTFATEARHLAAGSKVVAALEAEVVRERGGKHGLVEAHVELET